MQIITEPKLDFDDVLIRPKRTSLSSRSEVDLVRNFIMPHTHYVLTGTPIIASNMDTVGTIEVVKVLSDNSCFTALHKHYTIEQFKEAKLEPSYRDFTFFTFGMCEVAHIRVVLHHAGINTENWVEYPPRINLDVANGYQEKFVKFVKEVRTAFPTAIIMAGNVCTPDMTETLLLAGADIIKIGIGPGSQCETQKVTGVGYPQLSAIYECADAAHGLKGFICADGGCKVSGDVAKAFGAGADFVMLGTMLAGHKENISQEEMDNLVEYIEQDNINGFNTHIDEEYDVWVKTYGMSSEEAMNKHNGGMAEYRSSEGKSSIITYRGTIKNTLNQILGGLRSTCTYVGASSLKELSKRTTFVIRK